MADAGYRNLFAFWLGGGALSRTGNPQASITNFFSPQAVPQPQMPIAYVKVIYRYIGSPDPNAGEYPSSIPQFNQ